MVVVPQLVPVLARGRHRSARQGACFMEFASYLAGERWSDHPACTHPLLASLARDVNDLVGDDARSQLVALIPRVVGLNGDDPEIADRIAVLAAAHALPIVALQRQTALASALQRVKGSDATGRAIAAALGAAPGAVSWVRHLALPDLHSDSPASVARARAAVVHTAATGIALACVDDADARLVRLLEAAVDLVEELTRSCATATSAPHPQPVTS